MLIKTDPDTIQSFLSDASFVEGGYANAVAMVNSQEEVSELLAQATRDQTPVTISGAGTGTVAGRVPFGGLVIATEKLNQIKSLVHQGSEGQARAECGVRLSELQRFADTEDLFYPPDPTERSCFLGGTIATNASGARTFKYGPTRKYVRSLKLALPSGDLLQLRRNEIRADANGKFHFELQSGQIIDAQVPSYHMPQVRKHAAGYFVEPRMDLIDLFIGSEGTLAVVLEAEVGLLRKPEGVLSGVVFFATGESLLAFVAAARAAAFASRSGADDWLPSEERGLDARALEYFDRHSLNFLRQKYEAIPASAVGAVFIEQETRPDNEDALMTGWLALLERHDALVEESWFATTEPERVKLREFRHQLPVLMNEWFARYNQKKVSTDMAVPDDKFAELLRLYQHTLEPSGLRYTIFGHIGDNHVHVNILPRDDGEAEKAWAIYRRFIKRAVELGGTISAEHGIGKLKRDYLLLLYGEQHVKEMAALKSAFDPANILGRGNMFAAEEGS